MTQEEKNKKIPRELYANAYIETHIDIFKKEHERIYNSLTLFLCDLT